MVLPCSYLRQLLEVKILLILHLNVKSVVCSKVITLSIEYHSEIIVFRSPTLCLGDPIILEIKSLSKLFESKCA